MKKILFTAALAALTVTAASAQFRIGARAGLNFSSLRATSGDSNVRNNLNDAAKTRTGYHAGAVFRFGLGPTFIQPEVLYTQVRSESEMEVMPGTKISNSLTANYVQVPLLFGIGIGISKVSVHANVGPYASFWMSGTNESGNTKVDIDFDKDVTSGQKYNRMDVGLMAGAGVGIEAGPGEVHIDLRASQGLSDIYDYSGSRPNTQAKLSNRVFSLSLGYMFKLGL